MPKRTAPEVRYFFALDFDFSRALRGMKSKTTIKPGIASQTSESISLRGQLLQLQDARVYLMPESTSHRHRA
jgi:hypothetical protein